MKYLRNTFLLIIGLMTFFVFNTNNQIKADKIADISQYQGNINWSKASKSLKYVIIRVQGGLNYPDTEAKYNQAQAVEYDVPFGVYAYSNFSSKSDAIKEAQVFYSRSNKKTSFYVLDDEARGKGRLSKESVYANAWIKTMRKLTSKPLILYSGENYARLHGLNAVKFDGYWIANYSKKPNLNLDLWQYTSKGRVNGIRGSVDLSKEIHHHTVKKWFSHSNDD